MKAHVWNEDDDVKEDGMAWSGDRDAVSRPSLITIQDAATAASGAIPLKE